jgi:hypothetical protein
MSRFTYLFLLLAHSNLDRLKMEKNSNGLNHRQIHPDFEPDGIEIKSTSIAKPNASLSGFVSDDKIIRCVHNLI